MNDDRFITFKDTLNRDHTMRIVDIQAVGVGQENDNLSYIRAHDFPLTVPRTEALRVRAKWLKEG